MKPLTLSMHTIFICIFCFFNLNVEAQISDEEIEFRDEPVQETPRKTSPGQQQKIQLAALKQAMSEDINSAWSTNNFQLLEPYLSKELMEEKGLIIEKIKAIHLAYKSVRLGTYTDRKILFTNYKNQAEGHELRIRHFFREVNNSNQIFMIVIQIFKKGEKEIRYDFPTINGEIIQIGQDLEYDRFSSPEEQLSISLKGLEKSEIAMRDSMIDGFNLNVYIANYFEALIKLGKPTIEIQNFKFMENERLYKSVKTQFIIISYAEKNQFDEIQKFSNNLTPFQRKYFEMEYINLYYRIPNQFKKYRSPHDRIKSILENKTD
ncbi:MAG: hypothetical protein KDC24_02855 [Saprospiraceae bacterium]|nr:hypothetical protein [Saprospiraceae bacterium]